MNKTQAENLLTVYPILDQKPCELALMNEGEGPEVSIELIQKALDEDRDHPQ
jgi:hypothetical protein